MHNKNVCIQNERENIVIALAIYRSRFCSRKTQESYKHVPLESITNHLGVGLVCFLTCCEELMASVTGLDPGGSVTFRLSRIKANLK